jgi:hypothetical protein
LGAGDRGAWVRYDRIVPYVDLDQKRQCQRRWVAQRRALWLEENGPCVLCGSSSDLQVDHVDPETKVNHSVWSWSKLRRDQELSKCRVLCEPCHRQKSAGEVARGEANGQSKLTTLQVLEILRSTEKTSVLARKYGVCRDTVWRVRTSRSWFHLGV